jgi:hypothetical protein
MSARHVNCRQNRRHNCRRADRIWFRYGCGSAPWRACRQALEARHAHTLRANSFCRGPRAVGKALLTNIRLSRIDDPNPLYPGGFHLFAPAHLGLDRLASGDHVGEIVWLLVAAVAEPTPQENGQHPVILSTLGSNEGVERAGGRAYGG